MAQEDAGLLSMLNQAKYLNLRRISEPEENSLRVVVEEAIADHTETLSIPDPASPLAEILKGASPIKSIQGCKTFELQWSRYAAYLVTEEIVGSGGTCSGCTPNPISSTIFPMTQAATSNPSCITS